MSREKWTVTHELTLKGDLITLENGHSRIVALVDVSKWFNKVTLLWAYGLNYEWAKQQILSEHGHLKICSLNN